MASLDWPERVQFQHRLDNFDSDWVDGGAERHVRYSGLPFGQYQFHKFVPLPKLKSGQDWTQIGKAQGRPEESLHPEGFRMPITDKGEMDWLRNFRLSQEKARREKEEEHMEDE